MTFKVYVSAVTVRDSDGDALVIREWIDDDEFIEFHIDGSCRVFTREQCKQLCEAIMQVAENDK